MNISLNSKYALICGSTQGIGLAVAKELASLGATCILLARNEQKLQAVVGKLPVSDQQSHTYEVADFSDPEAVRLAVARVIKRFPVTILINNTGGPASGAIADATQDDLENAFKQHVVCNQLLVKAVLPAMKAAAYGRIVNIISTSVKTPLPNLGVSNTIRAAVAAWAKTLANEIGPFGITVNNVLPGSTYTGRLEALMKQRAQTDGQSIDEVEERMKSAIPLKRIGQPEEIANVVAFLASPAASYVSGVNIPVDGGKTPSI
ncbi:short-chain dehydrogenase [Parapedobacter defluvii]|uniref:Short-chain dehydrogenase n=1 Tax=Parapedobacter defluvii TaxID=2045106 RepID=A0ABQ1KWF6_9SPHI|nr:SDR family oxidoreductase [Parapedobacter defluvii]GGC13131.1 short-chain dehydrogenase [Parapedobacter defluvii]